VLFGETAKSLSIQDGAPCQVDNDTNESRPMFRDELRKRNLLNMMLYFWALNISAKGASVPLSQCSRRRGLLPCSLVRSQHLRQAQLLQSLDQG
jgi:hypothetical protein